MSSMRFNIEVLARGLASGLAGLVRRFTSSSAMSSTLRCDPEVSMQLNV